jgi:hypothetical protein
VGTTAKTLFEEASYFLEIIDEVLPAAITHEYSFMDNDEFKTAIANRQISVAEANRIVSVELLEKAHLASVTALVRTKRWCDAICSMYEAENFIGWAGAARGLLESSGDIVDALLQIPFSIAEHHKAISLAISGRAAADVYGFQQLENKLDHFAFAKWMRLKEPNAEILKAKENAEYIKMIEHVMPAATQYYRRLCGISHPANASIDFMFRRDPEIGGSFRLTLSNDKAAISAMCREFPDALKVALMMSCNPVILILRVLHKFGRHPKLTCLKQFDFSAIKGWPHIEHHLRT